MSALLDAAKQAARDEAAELGVRVSDYVVGRLVEAALGVVVASAQPAVTVRSWDADREEKPPWARP